MEENYEPFGEAWKAECMKFPKVKLVEMLADSLKALKKIEKKLEEITNEK